MAGDRVKALPEDAREWVDRRADELGVDRRTVLNRAVEAYRYFEAMADERPADAESRVEALERRTAELESRLTATEADVEEKLGDVRERVVQVKREADGKADADHGHSTLERDAERSLRAAADTRRELAALDDRVDDGFENFEEILEHLTGTTDDFDAKLTRLAKAHLALRSRVADAEVARSERARVDAVREAANRHGTRTADCEACGERVHVGLLGAPRCPHCEAPVDGVEPSPGLFRSATLTTGERPALESASGPASVDDLLTVGEDDDA